MIEEAMVAVRAIEGFGSAKFGSDVSTVLKAIATDFKINDGKGVRAYQHRHTGARVLTVHARGVVAGAPYARVSYIFDDQRQKLIQVDVDWAPWIDPSSTNSVLIQTTGLLRRNFLKDGYTDLIPEDKVGGPAFLARDQDNRFIRLILRRPKRQSKSDVGKEEKLEHQKLALTLSYIAPVAPPTAPPA